VFVDGGHIRQHISFVLYEKVAIARKLSRKESVIKMLRRQSQNDNEISNKAIGDCLITVDSLPEGTSQKVEVPLIAKYSQV